MKIIVLCGGIGSRLEDYSFPKPLNMIYGKPAIAYTLQNLPKDIRTIYFIVSPHLEKYNFNEIVTNLFKDRECIFLPLPYFTRGSIESAWCGTQNLPNENDNIIFLDNDVMYEFPENFFQEKTNAFLGYSIDNTSSEAYSFIQLDDNNSVSMIKEKKRISNKYNCGIYGFKSIDQFRKVALKRLNTPTESELYLSILFEDLLTNGEYIKGIMFPSRVTHIGSLKELKSAGDKIPKRIMRICFDLDNTLVTYPTIPGDYTTVNPIDTMIEYAKILHREGHTIIIHTARRMTTHNNNIGAVIKDIGKITFDTLDKFNIPYDELIFGKPIADMYIDDRSVNPYRNDMASLGVINYEKKDIPLNKLKNNKYNTIELEGDIIVKHGLYEFLKGEVNFYESFPKGNSIYSFFPKFYGSTKYDKYIELRTEYIKGIPFYTLYKSKLLTEYHIQQLFNILDRLHSIPGEDIPTYDEIYDNYIGKLKMRFANNSVYTFVDSEEYQSQCLDNLEIYLQTKPSSVPYIHGDFWFSNILLDFKNNIKLIDMKGRLESRLTLGGDRMYDYGKLYQSVLGYDLILNNETVSSDYSNIIEKCFFNELNKRNINIQHLKYVTISLMMGTLHFIETKEQRERVWNWLKGHMD